MSLTQSMRRIEHLEHILQVGSFLLQSEFLKFSYFV